MGKTCYPVGYHLLFFRGVETKNPFQPKKKKKAKTTMTGNVKAVYFYSSSTNTCYSLALASNSIAYLLFQKPHP
jgi:aspartate carbamoyltransferase catalytic subunit